MGQYSRPYEQGRAIWRNAGSALSVACLLLTCGIQGASAYSYTGPRKAVTKCSGQLDCAISANGQFSGIAIEGNFAVADPSHVLEIDFTPQNAQLRGNATLHSVALEFSDAGGELTLRVVRNYDASGATYHIDYPVTDPLLTDIGDLSEVHVDLTVYMSPDQAWIESREGSGALARVYTVPLFFGYGPNDPDTLDIHVSDTDFTTVQKLDYYTVAANTLIDAVNTEYAKIDWTYPFLFQGNQLAAASQLAAVDSAEGAAE